MAHPGMVHKYNICLPNSHTPLQELFNGKTLRNSKNAGRIRAKSRLFVLKKGKIAFKSRKT